MIDLKSLQQEIQEARRARIEAETAGRSLEYVINQMRAGRTVQQIELDEPAAFEAA